MRESTPAAVKRKVPVKKAFWVDVKKCKDASRKRSGLLLIYVKSGEKMNKQVYLDNAATTQISEEVKAAMEPYLKENYGNASTGYKLGAEAKHAIEEAREIIAGTLHAKPSEIYFTSGGSESDNWAVKNTAAACRKKGKHIITTKIEHHAILNSCEYLERLGYEVTYLPVNEYGLVSMEALSKELRPDTTLVTIMLANNEVGTIEPIYQIGKLLREKRILFHTDAVQAYAQIPLSVQHDPVDLLSASAHKFHGPKGVGFLYIREGVDIPSFIHGGSQERGKRAGTENVAGIVGMGKAAQVAQERMREKIRREVMLRNYMIERVLHEIKHVRLNGHRTMRLPGNVNFSFQGIEGASLLILMEEDGICASGGSACNTGEERISYVIKAMNVPKDYAPGTVRLTLSGETTREDVDRAVASMKKNIAILRG